MTSTKESKSARLAAWQPKGIEDYGVRYTDADVERIIAAAPGGLPDGKIDVQRCEETTDAIGLYQVDRKEWLIEQLETAAVAYDISKNWSQRPSPSDLRDWFGSIVAACDRVFETLKLPAEGEPDEIPKAILFPLRRRAEAMGKRIGGYQKNPPTEWQINGDNFTDWMGKAQVRDVLEGIRQLRAWSEEEQRIQAGRVKRNQERGHRGDTALNELFGAFAGIWIEIFEQAIGTSVGAPLRANAGQPTGPMVRFIQACLAPLDIELSDSQVRERIRNRFKRKGKSPAQKN